MSSAAVRVGESLIAVAGFLLVLGVLLIDFVFAGRLGPDLATLEREPLLRVQMPGATLVGHLAEDAHLNFDFLGGSAESARDLSSYEWHGSVEALNATFDDSARRAGWSYRGTGRNALWCRGELFLMIRPFDGVQTGTIRGYERDLTGPSFGNTDRHCDDGAPPLPTKLTVGGAVTLPFVGYLLLASVFRAVARARRGPSVSTARGLAHHATTFAWLPYLVVVTRPPPEFDVSNVARWGGIVAAIGGIAIAIWALVTLGRHFDLALEVHRAHEIIRHGPYAFVRHPIYSGLALHSLGACVATGSVILLWGTLAITLPVLFLRARTEERLLRRELGPAYDQYAREVPMIVPGLRPRR
jgi:protein-S-isoprenylcysteine O-methyltransferase Ste14